MYLWIPTVYRTFLQEGSFNRESCTTYFWNCNRQNNNFTYISSDKILNWGLGLISSILTRQKRGLLRSLLKSLVYLWRNLLYSNLCKLWYPPKFINLLFNDRFNVHYITSLFILCPFISRIFICRMRSF